MANNSTFVCITGDIDYFDTETLECLDAYFNVLKINDLQAEFFITSNAAEDYPDRVEYIIKTKHIVGGHGDFHADFNGSISDQTKRLKTMKKIFLKEFGINIEGFRAPYYKHNRNTFLAIENAGLKYDCSKKRFEIAFKRIPFYQKKYMYTPTYALAKPFLKAIGSAYNRIFNSPSYPYYITPNVLCFPTLGISDYSLIGDPKGPKYTPKDWKKICEIWIECLYEFQHCGGGVMTLQAHPGRMSPQYLRALDFFIRDAKKMGVSFSTPNELTKSYLLIENPKRKY